MENDSKSPHILNTSANLLGICFLVLTSFRALKMNAETYMDEFAAVAVCLFMASCVCSFLSMRSTGKQSLRYENVADYIFLCGLLVLCITTVFIVLRFMK